MGAKRGEASDDKLQQDLADFERGVVGRDGDVDSNSTGHDEPETTQEPSGQDVEASSDTTVSVESEGDVPSAETVAKIYLMPDDDVFGKFRGQKLTAAQMDAEGLIERYQTWGHQSRNKISAADKATAEMARQIEDIKKQLAEAAAKAQPEEAPVELTPEMVQKALKEYEPTAKEWAERIGESDFYEAYPATAMMIAYQVDQMSRLRAVVTERLNILAHAVVPVVESTREAHTASQVSTAQNRIVETAKALAMKEPVLSGLADDAHRGEFFDWMVSERNPLAAAMAYIPAEALNEDALRRMYYAFIADAQEIVRRVPNSRQASGGAGGSGSGAAPKGFDAELAEFERGVVRNY